MHVDFSSLRKALPYIKIFRDKVFVVKFGGELCEDPVALDRTIEQLALLSLMGIKLILIHGGGKHATALSEKLGVASEFVSGRRITSKEMLEVTKMSFAGQLNTDLIAAFRKHEIAAVGMSGIDGGLITAKKRPPTKMRDDATGKERDVDFGYVGDVLSVKTEVIQHLLKGGFLPVICSLAADESGQVFNINADTLASVIAGEIGAEKLCIVGTTDGVLRDVKNPSTLISILTTTEAQKLIEDKVATAGMIPKLTTALDALKRGVSKVHIISGIKEDAILEEIFTNEGSGTMLQPDL